MFSSARPRRLTGDAPRIRSVVACIAGVLLFACGGSEEPTQPAEQPAAAQPAEPAAPTARPQAPDESGLKGVISGEASVPDDFPSDVPPYPGAVPTASMSAAGQGVLVTFDSNDDPQMVFDFYQEALVDQGWTIESSATMGDQWMLSASKDDRNVRLSIASAPVGSQIGIAVARAE